MGWTNSHLYQLRAGDIVWGTHIPTPIGPATFLDGHNARPGDVVNDIGTRKLI
jgi:hypothetical protein